MEQVQIKLKNKDKFVTGEAVIYTGNFAILQTKEVKEGKVITNHEMYPMEDVQTITMIRDAEVRPLPESDKQLLVETKE
jgi:hypothetical protein